jgi:hypothetical protein
MRNWIFTLFLFSATFSLAQDYEYKRIKLYQTVATGFSYFHFNVNDFNQKINGTNHQFKAVNFRVGLTCEKYLWKNIALKASLRVGLRMKRPTRYEQARRTGVFPPYTFLYLDERVSTSNSPFVEIPLGLHYKTRFAKFGLNIIYRDFAIFNDTKDPIDLGIASSLFYPLSQKVSIGLEYYFGSIVTDNGRVNDNNGQEISYTAKNRFAQVIIEFKLK